MDFKVDSAFQLKAGDIVYYKRFETNSNRYGLVTEESLSESHKNPSLVWAKWANSLESINKGNFCHFDELKYVRISTLGGVFLLNPVSEEDLWE